jgi:hypothetical protein
MREIVTPDGKVYARIVVDEKHFKIQLANAHGVWVAMDKKIIPQLRQLLAEAEFFKFL